MSDLDGRRTEGLPHYGQRGAVKPSFGSPPVRRSETVKTFGNCYKDRLLCSLLLWALPVGFHFRLDLAPVYDTRFR
jgi:hypothetical protein